MTIEDFEVWVISYLALNGPTVSYDIYEQWPQDTWQSLIKALTNQYSLRNILIDTHGKYYLGDWSNKSLITGM